MRPTKYSKIPTARRQLLTTAITLLLCILFFYFFNPDAQLPAEMKRFMNRAGAASNMESGVLGAFGLIWATKNARNRHQADRYLREHVEAMRRLTGQGKDLAGIALFLEQADQDMAEAAEVSTQASNFDKTVANVGIGALAFLVAGTILQFWAA